MSLFLFSVSHTTEMMDDYNMKLLLFCDGKFSVLQ